MSSYRLSRRQLATTTAGLAVSLAAPAPLLAQTSNGTPEATQAWKDVGALTAKARPLGVPAPRLSLGPSGTGASVGSAQRALIHLGDRVDEQIAKQPTPDPQLLKLRDEIDELMGRLTAQIKGGKSEELRIGPSSLSPVQDDARFRQYKDQYQKLWNECTINPSRVAEVHDQLNIMMSTTRMPFYKQVEDETCAPWYFVGIAHGLEASFNMRKHLHNGDPLNAKTVQVPKGRPDPWLPPSDWVSSAIDAITIEHFATKSDWDILHLLYRLEGYNGYGYHAKGVPSPYLWSFTNQYVKGKYVADHVFDPDEVSDEVGAAATLKLMIANNVIQIS